MLTINLPCIVDHVFKHPHTQKTRYGLLSRRFRELEMLRCFKPGVATPYSDLWYEYKTMPNHMHIIIIVIMITITITIINNCINTTSITVSIIKSGILRVRVRM